MSVFDYDEADLTPEQRARLEQTRRDGKGGELKAVDLDDQVVMQRYFDTYIQVLDDQSPEYLAHLHELGGPLLVANEGFKAGFKGGVYNILEQLGTIVGHSDKEEGPRRGL